MSYLNQAQDPRRSTRAIVGVGVIHAAIGYALLTGLNVGDIERIVNVPLRSHDYTPPPPPPAPTPTPKSVEKPKLSDPVAPKPPIELPKPPAGPTYQEFDPAKFVDTTVATRPGSGEVFQPLPPRPSPTFTPRGARPSNNKSRWITTDDYPRGPLIDRIEGTTGYSLGIGTDGRVSGCEITTSSGNRALDAATCKYLASRARFEAATDGNGAKVAGSYSGSVHWEIPD